MKFRNCSQPRLIFTMDLLSSGNIVVGFTDNGRAKPSLTSCGSLSRLEARSSRHEFLNCLKAKLSKIKYRASCIDVPTREKICDALRFDYYLWERPNTVPDYLRLRLKVSLETEGKADPWKTRQDEARRDGYWEKLIPEFKQMDRRQWNRNTAVTYFTSDVLQVGESPAPCWYLFHYQQGNVKAYRFEDERAVQ